MSCANPSLFITCEAWWISPFCHLWNTSRALLFCSLNPICRCLFLHFWPLDWMIGILCWQLFLIRNCIGFPWPSMHWGLCGTGLWKIHGQPSLWPFHKYHQAHETTTTCYPIFLKKKTLQIQSLLHTETLRVQAVKCLVRLKFRGKQLCHKYHFLELLGS